MASINIDVHFSLRLCWPLSLTYIYIYISTRSDWSHMTWNIKEIILFRQIPMYTILQGHLSICSDISPAPPTNNMEMFITITIFLHIFLRKIYQWKNFQLFVVTLKFSTNGYNLSTKSNSPDTTTLDIINLRSKLISMQWISSTQVASRHHLEEY